MIGQLMWFCGAMFVEGVHPLQAGILRRKHRSERRPGLPRESAVGFGWRRVREVAAELTGALRLALRLARLARRVTKDPLGRAYRDEAITPASLGLPLPVLAPMPEPEHAGAATR
jgi:hypothetical protein